MLEKAETAGRDCPNPVIQLGCVPVPVPVPSALGAFEAAGVKGFA